MGWGTDFNTDIYLNKQTFLSVSDLDDHIKVKKESIQYAKEKLLILVCGFNGSKTCCSCGDNTNTTQVQNNIETLHSLHYEFNEMFEYLQEDIIELYKLELYRNYLIENNITDLKKDHDI